MIELGWDDVKKAAERMGQDIVAAGFRGRIPAYPIPRGGIYAAQAVRNGLQIELVEDPTYANIYIDDILDSGKTRDRVFEQHGEKPFFVLVDKLTGRDENEWYSFPWERMNNEGSGIHDSVVRFFQFIGEDPTREGLVETPQRVERSYKELFSGYETDPKEVIKVFEDDSCDEMVIVRNVEFFSTCEHHLLPFFGKAHIAYVPDGRVIGASKLARVLEVFARRLQIQERLCQQVTSALDGLLEPKGSACILVARHLCMSSRGIAKQGSEMITSSLTGVFRESGNDARRELLSMVGGE
jgi:GTP cyclohydrolase I